MSANWSLPVTTTLYTDILDILKTRDEDAARWFDSSIVAGTNLPTWAKRWNDTNKNFEMFNGTIWVPLSTTYGIDVTSVGGKTPGNAVNQIAINNSVVCTELNADKLDGFHGFDYLGSRGAGYWSVDRDMWLQFSATQGLYWPASAAGTHIYPNANPGYPYGGFILSGAKNTYQGLVFNDTPGARTLMMGTATGISGVFQNTNNVWDWTYDPAQGTFMLGAAQTNRVWHSGNDGAGSGLDADLFDGLNSPSFVRSDAPTTFFDAHYFKGAPTNGFRFNNAADTQNNVIFWDNGNVDIRGTILAKATGNNIRLKSDGTAANDGFVGANNIGDLYFGNWNLSRYIQVRADGLVVVNGYAVWTSGNDGSGSGMDADFLRGYGLSISPSASTIPLRDASGYLQATWVNIGNGSGLFTTDGHYFYAGAASGVDHRWFLRGAHPTDTFLNLQRADGTALGGIYANAGSIGFINATESLWHFQISKSTGHAVLNGSWTVWDSANDGAGSGLDADYLRGLAPSVSATPGTIVSRDGSGYIYGAYFNSNISAENALTPSAVYFEYNNDGFIRKKTLAQFKTDLGAGTISGGSNIGATTPSARTAAIFKQVTGSNLDFRRIKVRTVADQSGGTYFLDIDDTTDADTCVITLHIPSSDSGGD
jgi:hypothetical protein